MQRRAFNNGFTMLELSIVIVIIALVTGMGLVATLGALESAKRSSTENKLREIDRSLMNFRISKNRLPCPGDLALAPTSADYGLEAANPGVCTGGAPAVTKEATPPLMVEGSVPTRTLNLPNEYMYDGWGRKIAYSVDIGATAYAAFNTSMPNERCGISVRDASAVARSSRAMYALLSHGPNGHGGYLQGGTQMNAGSTNADEALNCHCAFAGPAVPYDGIYVQKSATQNPADAADIFDDIVFYKERWQLESYDDAYNYSGYKGARMTLGHQGGVYLYTHQCNRWEMQTDLSSMPNIPGVGASVIAFTPGNTHLVSYSEDGCFLYKVNVDGSYTDVSTNSLGDDAIANCPPLDLGYDLHMSLSDNGYMAMVATGEGLRLWKQSGNQFYSLPVPSLGAFNPSMVSLSKNADYLALADGTAVAFYKRTGDTFASFPITLNSFPIDLAAISFSPDGLYFGAVEASTTFLHVWNISGMKVGDAINVIFDQKIVGMDDALVLAFSKDGHFAAVGGGETGGDNISIFKIDAGNTFTQLALPTDWVNDPGSAGFRLAFSSDSKYVAMTTKDATLPLVVFRQTSPTNYRFLTTDFYPVPADGGIVVDFAN